MQKEEIDLRDRIKDFALRVLRMFSTLPKTAEAQVLGKQALRSGTSVGANYREAYRGRSKAEFIAKCGDSLRELEATSYWLELLVDAEIVGADRLAPLRRECDELTVLLPSAFSSPTSAQGARLEPKASRRMPIKRAPRASTAVF